MGSADEADATRIGFFVSKRRSPGGGHPPGTSLAACPATTRNTCRGLHQRIASDTATKKPRQGSSPDRASRFRSDARPSRGREVPSLRRTRRRKRTPSSAWVKEEAPGRGNSHGAQVWGDKAEAPVRGPRLPVGVRVGPGGVLPNGANRARDQTFQNNSKKLSQPERSKKKPRQEVTRAEASPDCG